MTDETKVEHIKELRQKILDIYSEKVINPLLGSGNGGTLKRELLTGLESVLSGIEIPSDIKISDNQLQNKEIDLVELKRISKARGYNTGTRAYWALKKIGIKTYGDLIAKFSDTNRITNQGNFRSLIDLDRARDIGKQTQSALYNHLNSLGINLFSTPYTSEELDVKGKKERDLNRKFVSQGFTCAVSKLYGYHGGGIRGVQIKAELENAGIDTYQDIMDKYKDWAETTTCTNKSVSKFAEKSLGIRRKYAKVIETHLRNESDEFK